MALLTVVIPTSIEFLPHSPPRPGMNCRLDRVRLLESCGTPAPHVCHGELERIAKLFTRC